MKAIRNLKLNRINILTGILFILIIFTGVYFFFAQKNQKSSQNQVSITTSNNNDELSEKTSITQTTNNSDLKDISQQTPVTTTQKTNTVETKVPVKNSTPIVSTPKIYTQSEAETYIESLLLQLVNNERKRKYIAVLKFDSKLAAASNIRVLEESDTSLKTQNHLRPNGNSFDTVFKEVGYTGQTSWGENLVYGYQSKISLNKSELDKIGTLMFNSWKNSPGHYENMVRNTFNFTGFGVNLVEKNNLLYYFGVEIFTRK